MHTTLNPTYGALARKMSLALPVACAGTAAWLLRKDAKRFRGLGVGLLGASAALSFARWQWTRLFSEKAAYTSEGTQHGLEFRRYHRAVRVETFIEESPWGSALKEGFQRLAGYISGENERGTHIPMAVPVLATTGRAFHHADRKIAFTMPPDRPLTTFPAPDDKRVKLREVPAHRVAVLSFRGRFDGDLPVIKRRELLSLVEELGYVPVGEVIFASYDPPWTLSLLRRNEVMVHVGSPN